jgi:ribosomal protein S18 acetylase RimI-like enzyme
VVKTLIVRLNQRDKEVALQILHTSLKAYRVEAKIIEVKQFPPLSEKLIDISLSINEFLGFYSDSKLAGVIELNRGYVVEICRLVVLPIFFKKGIASRLLYKALSFGAKCTVTTAMKNAPAIALYKKFGFQEISTHEIYPGLVLASFESRI